LQVTFGGRFITGKLLKIFQYRISLSKQSNLLDCSSCVLLVDIALLGVKFNQ
jgi:hypothetical protein